MSTKLRTIMIDSRTDCGAVIAQLSRFLDAELSPTEESVVRAHVASCSECARVLDDLKRTMSLLSQLPKPQPSPRLRNAKHDQHPDGAAD